MAPLPQLTEEDIERLDEHLRQLVTQTEATSALIIDKGGFLITSRGDARQFDFTTIAALASGAFMANQTIASLIHETNFNSVYQQGKQFSLFVISVNESSLLVVIFSAQVNVGLVKYFAAVTVEQAARQLQIAHERNPDASLDLSELNLADTSSLFKRRDA